MTRVKPPPERIFRTRRSIGKDKGGRSARSYDARTRSFLSRPKPRGWTATTFRLGRQQAFDAELEAVTRGLQLLAEGREIGASYTIFTDPQATM